MKEIKEYLEWRLENLNAELDYFEDNDEDENLASGIRTAEEVYEVKQLLLKL